MLTRIIFGFLLLQNAGRLKLQSSNVVFKNIKTGKVDQFPGEEVEKVQWLKRAKGFCLKIMLQNGQIHRFDGFKEAVSFSSVLVICHFVCCNFPKYSDTQNICCNHSKI